VDFLLRVHERTKRDAPLIIRFHAGEGYLGKGGYHTVIQLLRTVRQWLDREPTLGRLIELIVAHGVRIMPEDEAEAAALLEGLRTDGLRVTSNINPTSNILAGLVRDPTQDIGLLRVERQLPAALQDVVPGTDNVGSLSFVIRYARSLGLSLPTGADYEAKTRSPLTPPATANDAAPTAELPRRGPVPEHVRVTRHLLSIRKHWRHWWTASTLWVHDYLTHRRPELATGRVAQRRRRPSVAP
jgi:hypothetical protein